VKPAVVPVAAWLLRVLPDGAATAIAIAIADLSWIVLRKRRQTLEENLRYTAADRTFAERRRLGRETFRNLARCTVDFLRAPWMNRDDLLELVDWRGREYLDRGLQRGKGVLLLSGHLGNWELAGLFFAAHHYPIHTVAEDAPGDGEFRTYQRYRTATGMNVIPLGRRAGLAGYRALQRGDILGLLGDRVIAGRPHAARFCGGRRPLPIGPARLARRLGATVLIFHLVLNPTGARRYLCAIEPVDVEAMGCDDQQLTQAIADRFSQIVRQYPDQWFVFQPQWLPQER
jgi:lauroyl/myristoyl acyltransferase